MNLDELPDRRATDLMAVALLSVGYVPIEMRWARVVWIAWGVAAFAPVGRAQILQPGDVLSLNCVDDPTWSVNRVIASDGTISMPMIGSFAVGTSVTDARHTIESKLARVGYPVDVEVALVGTRRRVVSITGAVTRSIDVPWRQGLLLGDALTLACDIPPSAVVLTDGIGRSQKVALPEGASLLLLAGDRVSVPLSDHRGDVVLVGAFSKPGAIRAERGMSLAEAIAAAGGLALDADGTTMTIQLPGRDARLAKGDESVPAGAVVRVYQHPKAGLVGIGGKVQRPGPYRVRPGVGLMAVLKQAGWEPVEGAMFCAVGHLRQGRLESATYDLREIAAGKRMEPVLVPGDSVVVGS